MLQITGILKVKNTEQTVSDRFRKRDFVLTDASSQYPQHITFQLTQDKCSIIDSINLGEEITVSFNLRGREWKSPQGEIKYFNTLEAWRIEKSSASKPAQQEAPMMSINDVPEDYKDDLPF